MKKMMLLAVVLLIVLLSGCVLRERLLAPPEEWEAPEGTMIAVCTAEEDVHTYLYQGDGIYRYYINDVMQDEEAVNNIQEQAFLLGESMDNYLHEEYTTGQCVIGDYDEEEEYSFD